MKGMVLLREFIHIHTTGRHLIMYLCTSLVVIVILLPIFFIAYDNAEEIIAQDQIRQVSKGFWELESSIEQCRAYAYNLACNTDIVRLSLTDEDNDNLALYLYNLTLYQQNSYWENDLVEEVIIQFAGNSTLLTESNVYQDKRLFYSRFFSYKDLSYDEWQQLLFTDREDVLETRSVLYNNAGTQSFTLNYYYPSVSSPLIVISFIIPADQLLSTLMTDEIRDYGRIDLTVGTGDEPLRLSYDSGFASEASLLSLTSLLQPNLALEARLSPKAYAQAVSPIRMTLMIYILVSLTAAVILSVIFSRLNMRPLRAMIDFISQLEIHIGHYQGNAYAYIRQALDSAARSEEQLRKAYDLTRTSLEQPVFNMAVKGLPVSSQHLLSALGHISAFSGGYVLVAVSREPFYVHRAAEYNPDIANVTACRLFMERFREPYLYASDMLYAVLNVPLHGGETDLLQRLEDVRHALSDKLDTEICFGVSRVFPGPGRLYEAANQASHALKSAQSGLVPHTVQYESAKPIPHKQSPLNKERLFQLLIQEESQPLEAFCTFLIQDAGSRNCPLLTVKTTYYAIIEVCNRALAALSDEKTIALREYDSRASAQDNMKYLVNICLQIHETAKNHHRAQKQELISKALAFIHKHYSSPDLCLTTVADQFAVSERYLSVLIREQTGYSYLDYIMRIRMKEAQKLLRQTNMPINDIAMNVGYERPNSFYKSFKSYTGFSPRQYRSNIHTESAL